MFYEPKSARDIGQMVKNKIEADNAQRRLETRTTLLKSAAVRTKTVTLPPVQKDRPPKPPVNKERLEQQRQQWAKEDFEAKLAAIKASMNATPAERERAARTWGRPTAVMAMAKAIVDAAAKARSGKFEVPPVTDPTVKAILAASQKARTPTGNAGPQKGSDAGKIISAGKKRRGEI